MKSFLLAAFALSCTDPRRASEAQPAQSATGVAPADAVPADVARAPHAEAVPTQAATSAAHDVQAPHEPPSNLTEGIAGASTASRQPTQAEPAPSSEPTAAGLDTELAPALLAGDGTPLPQTHERPRTDAVGLHQRLVRLAEAIARDEPERALPAFFPRVAYERVKAVADPGRDWQQRLVRAFERDIHDYHRMLGPDAAGAQLDGLVVNERAVRWMEPGAEGNRLGYYRVTRARLRLRLLGGTTRELELTSLISWRGAWYVVHLHGFS